MAAPQTEERWTRQLAAAIADHPVGDFPQAIRHQAALVLADTVAAIAAGLGEPEIAALAARMAPGDEATLIGQGRRSTLADAAFFAGVAGCAVELDEGNYASGGHPGIHVVPVALAQGEALGLSGQAVLDAVIIGYEVAARIGRAFRPNPAIHSNGTWGTLGAAATVARLRGFDAGSMHQALCVAASLCLATSSGTSKAGASVRSVWGGLSARHGLLACDLVSCGFTGEAAGIETVFGRILGSSFDPAATLGHWGDDWEISRNFFKFDACCKETQGALQALSLLLAQSSGAVVPHRIERIDIETFDEAALLDEQDPPSALAARFSIPFMVASRLVHGHTGVSGAEVERMRRDPAVQALAARVEVTEDPALTGLVPHRRLTRMRVALDGNTVFACEVAGSLGDFDIAFDPVLIEQKFIRLVRASMRGNGAARFADLLAIEELPDIRAIAAALS